MNLQNKTIGVFFGGQSPEHDISIITGLIVMETLAELKIKTVPIYITRDGAWCVSEKLKDRSFLETIHSQDLYPLQNWSLDTRHRQPKLSVTRRPHFFTRRERVDIDIVFPAFHGAIGEDGSFQGLCETLGVPYVGCDVASSAIAMSKVFTKKLFQTEQVATADFAYFDKLDWEQDKTAITEKIKQRLALPVFVKPPHAGSSIGISKVKTWDGLAAAITTALEFDTSFLVENGVNNVADLTCCIRTDTTGKPEASLVQESDYGTSDFFDYQEKYLDGGGAQTGKAEQKLIIPANLPEDITRSIQEQSKQIFKSLSASGIARIDWLYNRSSGELYANEINPLPGTLYHHLWKKSGLETTDLVRDLLAEALQKQRRNQTKSHYFESSILGNVGGVKLGK